MHFGAGVWAIGFEASVLLLALAGIATVLLGLGRPAIAVLGVSMLVMMDFHIRELSLTSLLRWNTTNFILLPIIAFYYPLILKRMYLQNRILIVLLAIMAIWLLVSTRKLGGVQDLLKIVIVFAMVPLLWRLRVRGSDWFWLGVATGVGAIFVNIAFFQVTDPIGYAGGRNGVAQSPLAGVLVIAMVYNSAPSAGKRAILLLIASLCFGLVFLSGSRGSTITASLPMAYMLLSASPVTLPRTVLGRLSRPKWSPRGSIIAMTIVLAGAIAMVSLFPAFQAKTVKRFIFLFDSDRPFQDRIIDRRVIMSAGWRIFLDNPLGVGTGSFGIHFARQDIGGHGFEGQFRAPHSAWTKVLAENSIPGVVALAAYMLSFAYTGSRVPGSGVRRGGCLEKERPPRHP